MVAAPQLVKEFFMVGAGLVSEVKAECERRNALLAWIESEVSCRPCCMPQASRLAFTQPCCNDCAQGLPVTVRRVCLGAAGFLLQ